MWFDNDAPEEAPIPEGYNTSLDTFRKLLMIRAWCPDRVLPQSLKYISEQMGVKYAEGVILNIEEMWEESNVRIPMICFLSMGSDPTNNIEALSKKLNLSEFSLPSVGWQVCIIFDVVFTAFGSVSMGQGQEVHARRLLNQCQQQVTLPLLSSLRSQLPFFSWHRVAGLFCKTHIWLWISWMSFWPLFWKRRRVMMISVSG